MVDVWQLIYLSATSTLILISILSKKTATQLKISERTLAKGIQVWIELHSHKKPPLNNNDLGETVINT
jgi:hypothetical protein